MACARGRGHLRLGPYLYIVSTLFIGLPSMACPSAGQPAPLPSGVQDQMEYVITWGSFWAGLQLGIPAETGPGSQEIKRSKTVRKKMDAPTPSTPPAATAVTWQRRPDVDCCVMGAVLPGPGTVCTICATVGRAAPLFDHLRGTARTGVSWAGRGGTRTHVPKYRGIRPVAQMQSAT